MFHRIRLKKLEMEITQQMTEERRNAAVRWLVHNWHLAKRIDVDLAAVEPAPALPAQQRVQLAVIHLNLTLDNTDGTWTA